MIPGGVLVPALEVARDARHEFLRIPCFDMNQEVFSCSCAESCHLVDVITDHHIAANHLIF